MHLIQFAFLLILPMMVFAQPQPDTLWTRHLGGAADEMVNALCADGQGGYILAGHCGFNGDEMGPQDFYVCRTDSLGFPLWQQVIGVADTNEFAYGVTATENADVVFVGRNFSYEFQTGLPHVVRLDQNGGVVWDRTYGAWSDQAELYGICELPNNDLIAVGFHQMPETQIDAYLMRLTSNGDTVWTRSFGDSTVEHMTDLALTPNGDIIISGVSIVLGSDRYVRLMRFDTGGDLIWARSYDTGNYIVTNETELAVLPDGDLAVGTMTTGINSTEVWLMCTNADGDTLWTRRFYPDEDTNWMSAMCATADGGIMTVAGVGTYPAYQIALLKTNEAGELAWQRFFSVADHSMIITGLMETPDHCYVMSGSCWNFSNQADGLLIKTGPDAPEGVTGQQVAVPVQISLTAYPNPFNAVTTVTLALSQAMNARVILYDMLGRQETVISEQKFAAGSHRISIDGTGLASGVHIVELQSDRILATAKLLVLK